jgi:N6-L-threonylcarbamoyladenine synthase
LRKIGFDKASADEQLIADISASFQAAVVDVLIDKLITAAKEFNVNDIAVCGGVSANSELRRRLEAEAKINHLRLFIPKMEYCTDNGAMVAVAGYERMINGFTSNLELTAEPNLQLQ